MRAVVITAPGGPEVLEIRELPDPVPGPDELLVNVAATALNRADLLQRMGLYGGPHVDNVVPGLEFGGTVADMGQRVTGWSIGDPVMGIVAGGSYAEKLVIHHRQAIRTPHGMSPEIAAAIPESFMTAFDALVVQSGLAPGGRALVHAGASGLGTAAIQLVKARGGSIAVTCSTGKVERCRDLGADMVVDYTTQDFGPAVKEWAPGGVDVVLDVIGAEYFERNLAALRTGGTLIQVGVMGTPKTELNLLSLLPKRARIIGTVLRARPLEEKIQLAQQFKREVLPAFDAGIVQPIISSTVTLSDIVTAHRMMAANENIGKICVGMDE